MNHNFIPERDVDTFERRKDGPADKIDEAVVLSSVAGVDTAIDYMSDAGVPRDTALRVLSGPRYHRRPASRTVDKVLQLISTRMRPAKK